jgi:glutaminyl-tRNA synthetase
LYDRLFTIADPAGQKGADFKEFLNPHSLEALRDCRVEPAIAALDTFDRFQFERLGYFCVDPSTTKGALVLNRTVELRDSWAKHQKTAQKK